MTHKPFVTKNVHCVFAKHSHKTNSKTNLKQNAYFIFDFHYSVHSNQLHRFCYDIFKYVEADVDYDFKESPLPKKSIRNQSQRNYKKSIIRHHKNYKFER